MDYNDLDYGCASGRDLTAAALADLAMLSMWRRGATTPRNSISTSDLFKAMTFRGEPLPYVPKYVQTREVLNRLYASGKVAKPHKGGKTEASRWCLADPEWDRNNPFSLSEAAKPNYAPNPYSSRPNTDPEYEGTPPTYALPTSSGRDLVSAAEHAAVLEQNRKLLVACEDVRAAVEKTMAEGAKLKAENADLSAKLEEAGRKSRVIKIERPDGTTLTLKDTILPKHFDRVLALCNMRKNVLLVGPAGCGKTHAAELAAAALGLKFASVSCTAGMSEATLTGRVRPKLQGDDLFQTTDFLDCYEGGGVFLFDEFDAADPNLLLVVNTALANGYCNVPNRDGATRAKRHQDFVAVATANTFGRGATRVYAGRNQLDEATLDRFRIGFIECDYDRTLEQALCPDDELRRWGWAVRDAIDKAQLRRVMSTRFLRDAYDMKVGAGWSLKECQDAYYAGWSADERNKVLYQVGEARGY